MFGQLDLYPELWQSRFTVFGHQARRYRSQPKRIWLAGNNDIKLEVAGQRVLRTQQGIKRVRDFVRVACDACGLDGNKIAVDRPFAQGGGSQVICEANR